MSLLFFPSLFIGTVRVLRLVIVPPSFVFLLAGLIACKNERDKALLQLYRDGIEYLEATRAQLLVTRTADEAADVAENALLPLRVLVDRKKKLEQQYPELLDSTNREKIHSSFPEFHQLRLAARALYISGNTLANKYKDHMRFRKASREGWEMLAFF